MECWLLKRIGGGMPVDADDAAADAGVENGDGETKVLR
jgi:hypothetical protein